MASNPSPPIRLIVNGDDFGISHSANRAILRAHCDGILTTASLMVTGNACDHAVRLAHENPTLGVGLHLVLAHGKSVLKPSEIIGLCNQRFEFESSPLRAGLRYFFKSSLKPYLRQEINAQFSEFKVHGLRLDHLNGHLHFHLHPTVLDIIKRHHKDWNIRAMRVTQDPLFLNLRLAWGRFFYRFSHALIFNRLSSRARGPLARRGIRYTDRTFGLLQNDRITEKYLVRLLQSLRPGTYELYAHPDEDEHSHELEALISPKVRAIIEERRIQLLRYQDL